VLRWLSGCLAALLAAFVAGVLLWVHAHRADLPAPGDGDLIAAAPAEAGAGGFAHFEAAAGLAKGLDENDAALRAMRNRETWEPERLSALLASNAAALRELEQGVASEAVLVPAAYRAGEAAPGTYFTAVYLPVQQLVKLTTADAQRLARRGERAGALERAMFGLRVGRRISEFEEGDLMNMMFAVALQGIALDELARLVGEIPLTAREAKGLAARLEAQRIEAEAWREMWAVEYRSWKSRLAELPGADESAADLPVWLRWIPADYLYQPNRTLSLFAEHARRRRHGSELPCRDAFAGDASRGSLGDRKLRIVLGPNPVGNLLAEISWPNFTKFEMRRCAAASRLGLVQLAAGLKAYAQAEGALPDRLDRLVPTYLGAIPLDRFDGAPLRYSKARGVVYSIGEDLVDAGGSEPPAPGDLTEPTVSVAF
jgi:hypothetical protein